MQKQITVNTDNDAILWELYFYTENRTKKDEADFEEYREKKYWKDRREFNENEHNAILKIHTAYRNEMNRSNCVNSFKDAWYEYHDADDFEWIKLPFEPYHFDVVDDDLDKIKKCGTLEKWEEKFYLCKWENNYWILAKNKPEDTKELHVFDDNIWIDEVKNSDWITKYDERIRYIYRIEIKK